MINEKYQINLEKIGNDESARKITFSIMKEKNLIIDNGENFEKHVRPKINKLKDFYNGFISPVADWQLDFIVNNPELFFTTDFFFPLEYFLIDIITPRNSPRFNGVRNYCQFQKNFSY